MQRDQRRNGTLRGFPNAGARLLAHRRALKENNNVKDERMEDKDVETDVEGVYDHPGLSQGNGRVDSSEQRPGSAAASQTAMPPTHNASQALGVQEGLHHLPNPTQQSVSHTYTDTSGVSGNHGTTENRTSQHPLSNKDSSVYSSNCKYQKYLEELNQLLHIASSYRPYSHGKCQPLHKLERLTVLSMDEPCRPIEIGRRNGESGPSNQEWLSASTFEH